jgi:hypothetical protein
VDTHHPFTTYVAQIGLLMSSRPWNNSEILPRESPAASLVRTRLNQSLLISKSQVTLT